MYPGGGGCGEFIHGCDKNVYQNKILNFFEFGDNKVTTLEIGNYLTFLVF